jgi:hypothetical protein
VFDILDNIFTRFSQQTGIDVLDVTLSRVLMNFVVSTLLVKYYRQQVVSVPREMRTSLAPYALM